MDKYINTILALVLGSFLFFLLMAALLVYLTVFPITVTNTCPDFNEVTTKQVDYALKRVCNTLKRKKVNIHECQGR